MSWTMWLAFLAAALVIAVSPGPGAVLSMSTGLRYGYAAALRAIAGLQIALLLQLCVVALGLGAVLATSEAAFAVVKFAGAAYLIWLGVHKWRSPPEPIGGDGEGLRVQSRRQLYAQGILVNLTNPKAIVFIAALVPQFIVPDRPQWPQFAIIGATMVAVDMMVMSCYALLATRFRPLLRNPRLLRLQNRIFGGLFVGAGAMLAASSR
ncbi:homoserine/homoserine lactone efflux protein [Thauera phenylacetica]|jgi:homoserine/homoserine lactone efflux protein|uniref:Lysine exporter LysE/YggA n=1 Tax=Thauera phenylacetica B4P TaxID=1234382 RepID=N6ZNB5_9RHOO|nr:homoserine/homoserine lactone efflux protein [Thauera phenylacetica]ENO96017.1 lysine exporter LysE/YggA [Thauera phenylacetica B4P]MBP7639446.1 homoserine/homoserine lactone efflux protein [Thauera sp.]